MVHIYVLSFLMCSFHSLSTENLGVDELKIIIHLHTDLFKIIHLLVQHRLTMLSGVLNRQ